MYSSNNTLCVIRELPLIKRQPTDSGFENLSSFMGLKSVSGGQLVSFGDEDKLQMLQLCCESIKLPV